MPKLIEIQEREVIFCDENGDPLTDVKFSFGKVGPGIAYPDSRDIAENGTIEIPKEIEFPIAITAWIGGTGVKATIEQGCKVVWPSFEFEN